MKITNEQTILTLADLTLECEDVRDDAACSFDVYAGADNTVRVEGESAPPITGVVVICNRHQTAFLITSDGDMRIVATEVRYIEEQQESK